MALEWNRTDLALFPNGNRKDYEPLVLIEAKRLDQSCLSASHQVKRYGEALKQVKRLLVTDGIRYGLFTRQDETQQFSDKLSAYMNLADLRGNYPIYGQNCGGADEVMLTLSAAWSEKLSSPKLKKSEIELV